MRAWWALLQGQIARATSKPTLVLTQNGSQIQGFGAKPTL